MGIILSLVVVWISASIPISLLVGYLLAARDTQDPNGVELVMSTGDIVNIY